MGDDLYTLYVQDHSFRLPAGQRFDFTKNGFARVSKFVVTGIAPKANLSLADPQAFVTEVTFGGAGRFTGKMTPMDVIGELADLLARASARGTKAAWPKRCGGAKGARREKHSGGVRGAPRFRRRRARATTSAGPTPPPRFGQGTSNGDSTRLDFP